MKATLYMIMHITLLFVNYVSTQDSLESSNDTNWIMYWIMYKLLSLCAVIFVQI